LFAKSLGLGGVCRGAGSAGRCQFAVSSGGLQIFVTTPRTSRLWRRIVFIAPIVCIPLGLVLREKWVDLFRLASLPFWVFMLTGTLLQYLRKPQPEEHEPLLGDKSH
jgi:hypothetical protein